MLAKLFLQSSRLVKRLLNMNVMWCNLSEEKIAIIPDDVDPLKSSGNITSVLGYFYSDETNVVNLKSLQ